MSWVTYVVGCSKKNPIGVQRLSVRVLDLGLRVASPRLTGDTVLCLRKALPFNPGYQWRSKNAEKVTHIKGRLLDQAVIVFHCVPFRGREFFPLRAVPYGKENHFYHIK